MKTLGSPALAPESWGLFPSLSNSTLKQHSRTKTAQVLRLLITQQGHLAASSQCTKAGGTPGRRQMGTPRLQHYLPTLQGSK